MHTQTRPHVLQGGTFGAPSLLRAAKGRGRRPERRGPRARSSFQGGGRREGGREGRERRA